MMKAGARKGSGLLFVLFLYYVCFVVMGGAHKKGDLDGLEPGQFCCVTEDN